MLPAVHVVSESIAAPADVVYAFAQRVENLPRWAAGLAGGVERVDGDWFAASPMGRVRLVMAPPNPWRVLDHDVTLPDGRTVHNAMRVTPCEGGCVVAFVALRPPEFTDEAFAADLAAIARDLRTLRRLLEPAPPPSRPA